MYKFRLKTVLNATMESLVRIALEAWMAVRVYPTVVLTSV
jgi:hypothetical protein